MTPKSFMTVKEVSTFWRCSNRIAKKELENAIKENKVSGVVIGNTPVVNRASLLKYTKEKD